MMKNAVWVYITYTPLRTSLRQLNHEPFTDDRNIPTPAYPARIGCRPERGDRSVIWREAPWRLTSVAMRAKFFNVIYPRHLWKTGHEFGHCGRHLFYLNDDGTTIILLYSLTLCQKRYTIDYAARKLSSSFIEPS
jgi:hypothetical protein